MKEAWLVDSHYNYMLYRQDTICGYVRLATDHSWMQSGSNIQTRVLELNKRNGTTWGFIADHRYGDDSYFVMRHGVSEVAYAVDVLRMLVADAGGPVFPSPAWYDEYEKHEARRQAATKPTGAE